MAGGYMGRYAIIDVGTGEVETVEPGDDFYRKYLTGYGLGAAVITERQKPGADPLAPESYLGFCSGLLTGTGAYFSGRYMVVGKSPLTGGWGDANSGGFWSVELKRAGYDALFVTGKSDRPVWINVTDNSIEIKDAAGLWGKDTTETEELIREMLGDKKVRVASIGESGEKISLISGIVTDAGRIAARSGLGAVMGSKNLKAVAVRGTGRVPVADEAGLKALNKKYLAGYRKSDPTDRLTLKILHFVSGLIARTGISVPGKTSLIKEIFKKYGTTGTTAYSGMIGDSPVKNWAGSAIKDFPIDSLAPIADEGLMKDHKKRYACQACPLGCGAIFNIQEGRYKGTEGHRPEYETLCGFGTLLLNDDPDSIIEVNEMCNRAGIDTISAAGAVAFAIECFENGLIDKNTTGGLELAWGKADEIVTLTEMIIKREGFGDTLADGVKKAAAVIGRGSEPYAVHAGGQELPMHDPKFDPGHGFAYQCEPTPGRHTIACDLYAELWAIKKTFPAVKRAVRSAKNRGEKHAALYLGTSNYMQVLNGCGICEFGPMTAFYPLVDYLNLATGWNLSADEYLTVGERILNLRKAFNVREGITAEDTKMHGRGYGNPPLAAGPLKGVTLDMESMEKSLFTQAGWDISLGGPNLSKLEELQLDELFGNTGAYK